MKKLFQRDQLSSSERATPIWDFDHEHTRIAFSISHMGFSITHGYFSRFSGELHYQEGIPEKTKVVMAIEADSVSTLSEALNQHLRSEDFFNVAEYPEVIFVGEGLYFGFTDEGQLEGALTLLGVTNPVTLLVTLNKHEPNPMSGVETIGFQATTVIKRSQWGLNFLSPNIGEEVRITIDGEVMRRATE